MSTEQNKAVVRRFFEEIMLKRNLALVDELVAPDFVDHTSGLPPGPEPLRQALGVFLTAFPDLEGALEQQVAEGDLVANRYTFRGTHLGDLFGLAPTGRQASWVEMDIVRFAGGKMVERWYSEDRLGQQQQLGLIPGPGQ